MLRSIEDIIKIGANFAQAPTTELFVTGIKLEPDKQNVHEITIMSSNIVGHVMIWVTPLHLLSNSCDLMTHAVCTAGNGKLHDCCGISHVSQAMKWTIFARM